MAPLVPLIIKALIPLIVQKAAEAAITKAKEKNVNETAAGLIRHALTTAGGVLVAKGWADAGMVEAAAGALTVLIGVAWSMLAKRRKS